MTEREYCVYKHTSPTNKVYIGITCQEPEKRWRNGKGYADNDYFYKSIQKYGWENFKHEILAKNLTQEEAYKLEIEIIKKYDSTNREKGYNAHKGGEGSHPDIPCSIATRMKRSQAMKNVNKGRYVGGKSAKARKVKQYDLKGNLIAEYGSSTEASKAVGVDYSCIVRCCRGQNAFSANFLWCYDGEENTIQDKVIKANRKKHLSESHKNNISKGITGKMINHKGISKPVIGTNIKTGETIYFPSMSEAERHGFDASNIGKCISDKYPMYKSVGGYSWRYA